MVPLLFRRNIALRRRWSIIRAPRFGFGLLSVPRKKAAPVDIHVGQRMRARRMELQMTQTDLADGFGLTFQQIQKYESGTNRMGSSRLAQAARILRVTPAYFFANAGSSSDFPADDGLIEQMTEFLADTDAMALVRAFQRVQSKRTRRAIVAMVAELVENDR